MNNELADEINLLCEIKTNIGNIEIYVNKLENKVVLRRLFDERFKQYIYTEITYPRKLDIFMSEYEPYIHMLNYWKLIEIRENMKIATGDLYFNF